MVKSLVFGHGEDEIFRVSSHGRGLDGMGELGSSLGARHGEEVGSGIETRSGVGEFWLRCARIWEES